MRIDTHIKNEIESELEMIHVPSSLYEFAKNIKRESEGIEVEETMMVKKPTNRKWHFVVAAIVSLGVITGSAFMNPTMAEIASKIPYLGRVFHSKPVLDTIHEALEEKGYKAGVGMRPGKKVVFEIFLEDSEKDFDRKRDNITTIVTDILKSRGYDHYKITVSAALPRENWPISEEDTKLNDLAINLENGLRDLGYQIIVVNPYSANLEVNIPLTETRGNEIKEATLRLAKTLGSSKNVEIISIDEENREKESTWIELLGSIHEGLALKNEYQVSGYGYSYRPEKIKIIIYTSMSHSDKNAKGTVGKIRKEVMKFLESEEVKTKVENQPYEIIIRDKKGKYFPF